MNFEEIKKYVKKDLTKFLKPYGFIYDAKVYSFLNVSNNGSIGVLTPIGNYSPLFKLGFSFTIRINAVEDIFNEFGRVMPSFQKYTSTIIVQYDYFKNKKYFDYHLYNEFELAFALNDFKEIFIKEIFPFLLEYSHLNKLYQLVQNAEIANIDSTVKPDNYIHWMIIEKLYNGEINKLNTEKLVEYLQKTDVDQDKKRIISFFNYIDYNK